MFFVQNTNLAKQHVVTSTEPTFLSMINLGKYIDFYVLTDGRALASSRARGGGGGGGGTNSRRSKSPSR